MANKLTISPSPHEPGHLTTPKLMYGVVISLIPALAATVYYFGWAPLLITAVSIISCVTFEYLIQKFMMKVPVTVNDGSAVVTGLLMAFCLPVNIPLGLVVLGALVAIGIGKMTFGGLGNNPFNPALVGRVFLFLSFPVQLTSWPVPKGFETGYTDAVTGPTPLGVLNEGYEKTPVPDMMPDLPGHSQLFFGDMGGSLGEMAAIALLLGLAYLLIRKIISWHIPVIILATVFVFSGLLYLGNPEGNTDPLYQLLSGGLLLGAIYMATDYVTSPMSKKGMVVYAVGIGILTVIIRRFGAYPEGVQFAILIMNAFTPLINSYLKPKRFGEEVQHG